MEAQKNQILIVEDDAGLLELLSEKIQESGCDVICAISTKIAFNWLKKNQPTLMLLDYSLPDMNGSEFIDELLNRNISVPPFILATGQGDERIAVKMMKLGARDYIIKDSNYLELIPIVVSKVCKEIEFEVKFKMSEQALIQSREEFKDLFENAPIGYHEIDLEGRIVRMNQTELNMLGYTIDEVTAKYIWEIISDSEYSREQTKQKLSIKEWNNTTYERDFLHKNGSKIPVLLKDKQIRSESDEIIGNRTSVQDISELKQTEKVLKLRETYLTAIIENLPGMIWLKDANYNFLLANMNFAKTCGKEKSEYIVGKSDFDIWPENLAEQYVKDDQKVIAEKKPLHLEEPIYDKDSIKWFETFKMPIFDDNTEVIGTAGYAQDISERKIFENQLRDSEELYRLLAENTTDVIWKLNLDGKYTYVSPSIFSLRGFTAEEVMNQTMEEMICKDSLPLINQFFEKSLREYSDHNITESGYLTIEQPCKDGTTVWTELTAKLICDENGEPTGYIGVSRNISERHKAEQELEKVSKHYQAIIEKSPDGFVLLNDKGLFKYASPSALRMFGYELSELTSTHPDELTHPDDLPMVLSHLTRLFGNPDYLPVIEYRFRHKSGEWFWIESTFSNLLTDPNVESILINFRAINERKQAEEKLLRHENLLKDMLLKSSKYIESNSENIDFEELCRQIQEISGAKYVSFNLYEPNGLDFRTVALYGMNDIYSRAAQFLGYNLKDKVWSFDPLRDERIKTNAITRFENMLDLNGKTIPKTITKILQQTLNLGEIDVVNISKQNYRIGDFTLYFEKNKTLQHPEIVELFSNQVALFVERKLAEKKRDENELRLKRAELASKSGNWEFHLNTNKMIVSDGANLVYGLNKNRYNYDDIRNVPLPEYRLMMDAALKNLIEKNAPYNIEFKIKTANTAEIKDIHSTATFDKDSKIVFGIIQDITDIKKAEEKLILSEVKFRNAFENSVIGKSITTFDGKLDVNDAFCNITGYSKKELSAMTWMDFTYKDDLELNIKIIDAIINGEYDFKNWEKRYIHKDGHIIWVDITTMILRDQHEKPIHLVTEIFDITARKQAEEALRESENKYKILFADNPQPMLVYDLQTLAVLEVNQTAVNFYGYSKDEFLSMTVLELHPKSETAEFLKSIDDTKAGKKTDGISLHQKKNGENVYVQVSSTQTPIYGPNARHILIVDITQRLIAEQKLAESERFFRQSQEAAQIGSYNLNFATGTWTSSVVLDEIFGIDNQYVRSVEGWLELVAEEDREMMNDYFASYVVAQRQRFNKEYRVSRKSDGKVFWVLGLGELIIENDVIISMVGTIQDITNRKLIEDELKTKMDDLIRFQKVTVGRELMMIDLKKEINELLAKLGQEPKYKIVG